MYKYSILFIGLDTHEEFNEVAYIEEHRGTQSVHLGRVSSTNLRNKSTLHIWHLTPQLADLNGRL